MVEDRVEVPHERSFRCPLSPKNASLSGQAFPCILIGDELDGAAPAGGTRNLTEIAREFIQHRRSFKDCKARTITQYESYFKVIKEKFGEVNLSELKRADIKDWLAETDWSPRTRKNYLVTLTTVFNFAIKRD